MECLSDEAIFELVEGRTPKDRWGDVDLHISRCSACRELVAEIARPNDTPERPQASDEKQRLGRYEIVRMLGIGGMGIVYEAFDPHLSRSVALKVIRSDQDLSDEGQPRLLREARAMAQVSHPNVVTVHDVEVVDGEVFLAMELVDGRSMRQCIRERLPWRDLLRYFMQAGEGLAAAHRAKLVHRDFKPDNVLVGKDDRVRVTDFGLARLAQKSSTPTPRRMSDTDVLATITRTDMFVGTPAYMSPEQFAGREASAQSDQFGFSVALYEALYGERPFAGTTTDALCDAVTKGLVSRAPTSSNVPAAVRRVLLRALSPNPDDRYASMRELLGVLDRAARPRRWRIAAVAIALVAIPIVIVAWPRADRVPPRPDPVAIATTEARADPTPTPSVTIALSAPPSATPSATPSASPKAPATRAPPHPSKNPRSAALKPFDEGS